MAMQVKKNKNKERSMYHHGLVKMLVEHQLQQCQSWNILLWENEFISEIEEKTIQSNPPFVHQEENTLPQRRITRVMNKTKKIQEEIEKERRKEIHALWDWKENQENILILLLESIHIGKKFYDHLLEKEKNG